MEIENNEELSAKEKRQARRLKKTSQNLQSFENNNNNNKDDLIYTDNSKIIEDEIPSKLSYYFEHLKRHTLKNVQFYFLMFLILFVFGLMKLDDINENLEIYNKINKEKDMTYIAIRDDNTIVAGETAKISLQRLQNHIADIIIDYLPQSLSSIKHHTPDTNFVSFKDFLVKQSGNNNKKSLDKFYQTFISLKNIDSEMKKNNLINVTKDFEEYLRTLMINIEKKEMPLVANIINYEIKDFKSQDKNFAIIIDVPMVISGVTLRGKKFSGFKTNSEFKISGFIDLEERISIDNPFGIKFTKIETKIAVVNQNIDIELERQERLNNER